MANVRKKQSNPVEFSIPGAPFNAETEAAEKAAAEAAAAEAAAAEAAAAEAAAAEAAAAEATEGAAETAEGAADEAAEKAGAAKGLIKKKTSSGSAKRSVSTTLINNRSASKERKQAMRDAREEQRKRNEAIVEEQRAKNEAGFEKAMTFANAEDEDFFELKTEDEFDLEALTAGFTTEAPLEDDPEANRAAYADSEGISDEEREAEEEAREAKRASRARHRRKVSFTMKANNIEGGEGVIAAMVERHRTYYTLRNTLSFAWRDKAISRVSGLVKKYETPLVEAIRRDLGISKYEAYMTEIAPLHEELKYLRKKASGWTKNKRSFNLKFLPNTTFKQIWQPYGTVCIINSWQSPVLGTLLPFVDAIAAGNSIVIKTDARMWRCNEVLSAMIAEVFKPDYAQIIFGDEYLDELLVKCRFDKIFYCGEREHAEELSEVMNPLASRTFILEGSCPCVVDSSIDVRMAAERIMTGKMIHAGQTRISPSVVFASERIYKPFINRIYEFIKRTYGDNPITAKDYPRMISKKEFNQACELMEHLSKNCEIVVGGEYDEKTLRIAPTIILVKSIDDPILKKKIIGPILPVVVYTRGEDAYQRIDKMGTPAAFYLFSKNKGTIRYTLRNVDFGTGCINDTMVQIGNRLLPYSAVGTAGNGAVGGRAGVQEFGMYRALAQGRKSIQKWRLLPYPDTIDTIKRKFHYSAR